jgi:hypothetical protein
MRILPSLGFTMGSPMHLRTSCVKTKPKQILIRNTLVQLKMSWIRKNSSGKHSKSFIPRLRRSLQRKRTSP